MGGATTTSTPEPIVLSPAFKAWIKALMLARSPLHFQFPPTMNFLGIFAEGAQPMETQKDKDQNEISGIPPTVI